MKIYIVQGTTGEYDNTLLWLVTAYTEKEMAELHCSKSNEWLKEKEIYQPTHNELGYLDSINYTGSYPNETGKNPYDLEMRLHYTGTRYDVVETELFDHLDQFLGLE